MLQLVRLDHSSRGAHHNRDINASINLKDEAIKILTANATGIPKYRSTMLTFHEYDVYLHNLFVNEVSVANVDTSISSIISDVIFFKNTAIIERKFGVNIMMS